MEDQDPRGPVEVWELQHARVVHELFGTESLDVGITSVSPDDRHIALRFRNDELVRLIDWRDGLHWRLDDVGRINLYNFSPKGRWLSGIFFGTGPIGPGSTIEVETRKLFAPTLRVSMSHFSSDERLGMAYEDKGVSVWDLGEVKRIARFSDITTGRVTLSPDGSTVLSWRIDETPEPPRPAHEDPPPRDRGVDVWDVSTSKLRFRREFLRVGRLEADFAPDGRVFALYFRDDVTSSQFEMLEAGTGQLLWSFPMTKASYFSFSPDGAACWLLHGDGKQTLTVFDAGTGRVLWNRPGWGYTYFAGDTGVVVHQDDQSKPLQFIETRTGRVLGSAPRSIATSDFVPRLTSDGRHLCIGGWQRRQHQPYSWETWLEHVWPEIFGEGKEGTLVLATDTGREALRVLYGKDGRYLSDDAGTLVTVDRDPLNEATIRVWDVPPHRAWTWAGFAFAGTWLALACLQRIARR